MKTSPRLWAGHLETNTPVATVCIAVSETGLAQISLGAEPGAFKLSLGERLALASHQAPEDLLAQSLAQVRAYLAGELRSFDLPVDWSEIGTFQAAVLAVTCAIPYGQVLTYSEVAARVDHPGAARAAGVALARNPIPLIIPCHRVLGRDGRLHGYNAPGGVKTKAWLLTLEGYFLPGMS